MSEHPTILFVDDDPKAGALMQRFSAGAHYACLPFQDPRKALAHFEAHGAAMIITDLRMPGMSGIDLLARVREQDPDVPVVIITGYSSVDSAVEALRLGATDFIKKPFDMEELHLLIEKNLEHTALVRENRALKHQLSQEQRERYGMVGHAESMHRVHRTIEKIADIRCNVIIEGESGTGKELAARAIHFQSQFAERPFITIDCGALTDTLLESELFGHEKGAFTGAVQAKQGLLEVASGGTVFLDEICNISDAMQTKLLRVVQEQQVTRVGGVRPIDIDVRFIVATNRDLDAMVAQGKFRHDLYHRLNVVKIRMPPLRERREDIPLLIQHFVDRFAAQYHRDVAGFDPQSVARLCDYDWPGNIRELSNLVERHVALVEGPLMHLDEELSEGSASGAAAIDADLPSLAELERRYVLKVLAHFDQNREQTAQALGINKSTLWRKLQQWAEAERGAQGEA
ncbi:sigma-54-dependent Fis family transcriptional regulator [Ectothiorhodospiraceae bacterium 2226]|nr:sigma-54-dependent Fis family transcriptional regulator [Ectothiorhodospiraceae bacterium 2226]